MVRPEEIEINITKKEEKKAGAEKLHPSKSKNGDVITIIFAISINSGIILPVIIPIDPIEVRRRPSRVFFSLSPTMAVVANLPGIITTNKT